MEIFTGLGVSPGYGHGPALVYRGSANLYAAAEQSVAEVPEIERDRFAGAVRSARRELRALHRRLQREYGEDEAHILSAQFLMLEDPLLHERVENAIAAGDSAEHAVVQTVRGIEERFASMEDPYLRERSVDVHDVGGRILHHLADRTHHPLARLPDGIVLVAPNLVPSDTIFLDRRRVHALVTERGGENSHVAILARSLRIPAVTHLEGIVNAVSNEDPLLVDGVDGRVVLRPDEQVREQYERRARRYRASVAQVREEATAETVTRDGLRVEMLANIGRSEEAATVRQRGARGVGLLRTEFLYIAHGGAASEQDQAEAYRRVVQAVQGAPVIIRTLDLGPDKILPVSEELPLAHAPIRERGVHHSLRHPELFRPQLRAILRASTQGDVRILLPMVTGVHEVREVRRTIEDLRRELDAEGIHIERRPPLGAMIETPPAILMAEEIGREADFLSLGSNDLLQYMFAREWQTNRIDDETPCEPSFLRAIRQVVEAARTAGSELTLCGEMAGEPAFTALLLGLGITRFSMSPERIPEVSYALRQLHADRARELARRALGATTTTEVRDLLGAELDPWRNLLHRGEAALAEEG